MPDNTTTIKEMLDRMADFVAERDWEQYHSPKNLAMGLAIETGELLEHFQWIDSAESYKTVENAEQFQLIKEEVADCLSYILAIAGVMGIDLSDAYFEKMKKNAIKYPADIYRGKYKVAGDNKK